MYTEKTQESLKAKIAELLMYSPKFSKTYADTYIFEPSNEDEERFGKLFIVIEIEHQRRTAKEVADAIATIMQHEYYQNDAESVEEHFERAITRTNEILGDLAEQGETSWVSKVHAVIATLTERQLYITKTGSASAFLFRNNEAINITEHLYDESQEQTPSESNPLKTFMNVASGFVEEKDKILFATPKLFEELDAQAISSSIVNHNPIMASTRLQALLQAKKAQYAIGALITEINRKTIEETIAQNDSQPLSVKDSKGEMDGAMDRSLDDVSSTTPPSMFSTPGADGGVSSDLLTSFSDEDEERTDAVAKERNAAYFKDILAKERMEEPHLSLNSDQSQVPEDQFSSLDHAPSTKQGIFNTAKKVVSKRLQLIRIAITHLRDPRSKSIMKRDFYLREREAAQHKGSDAMTSPSSRTSASTTYSRFSRLQTSRVAQIVHTFSTTIQSAGKTALSFVGAAFTALYDFFTHLPKRSRFIFIGVIVLLVFGIGIGSFAFKPKQDPKANEQAAATLSDAEKKYEDAQTALIYGDEIKATSLLQEAQALQGQVSGIADLKDRSAALQQKIQQQFDILYKITRIESPVVAFQLSDAGAAIPATTLLGNGTTLYTFNPTTNDLYELNGAKSTLTDLNVASQDIGHLQKGIFNPKTNELLFATDAPGIARYSLKTKKLENVKVTLEGVAPDIRDIDTYNGKMYLLDAAQNQVMSYTPTTAGFSKGSAWIKEASVNLSNATAMTIDGAVYVLSTQGTITKYLRGVNQNMILEQLQIPLTNPTDIFTTDAIDNLYILDPKNNRVVVTTKEGKLVRQLVSEPFGKATSIFVTKDKTQEQLYVLSSDKVLQIKSPATL